MKLEKYNNIITGFGSNIIGNVLMFITTIFLTRIYPSDIYGEFRFIFSFIALSVIILLFGRDNGIIYYTQNTEIDKNKIIKEEVFFGFIVLVFGMIFLYVMSDFIIKLFFNNIHIEYFQFSLIMIPLWGLFNLLLSALKAKGMINYSFVLSNFIQRIVRVPFFIILTLLSISYYSLALAMILSQLLLVYFAVKKLPFVIKIEDINIKDFFKRFSYSLQLGINAIIIVLLTKVDVIMIGAYTDNTQVAIYDTCVMLAFVTMLPFIALVKSSEPIMKALIKDEFTQEKFKKNSKLAIELSLGILLIYSLTPSSILHIFGSTYTQGADALVILSLGYMILVILGTPIEFLNMNGFTKISSIVLIFSILINIVLNYLLIPRYGIEGASLATAISLIFSKIIGIIIVSNTFGHKLIRKLFDKKVFFSFVLYISFVLIFKNIVFDTWIKYICFSVFIAILYFIMLVVFQEKYRKLLMNIFLKE